MGGSPLICLVAKNFCYQTPKLEFNLFELDLFYMLPDNPNFSLKIVDCSLFTRRILVAEPNHQNLQWNLEREPAQYNYMETKARTFIIPSRQNQFIQENIFSNGPIRKKKLLQ